MQCKLRRCALSWGITAGLEKLKKKNLFKAFCCWAVEFETATNWLVTSSLMSNYNKIYFSEKHMLPYKQHLFKGCPYFFQEDNAKLHSTRVPTARLIRKRPLSYRALAWVTINAVSNWKFRMYYERHKTTDKHCRNCSLYLILCFFNSGLYIITLYTN